MAKTRLEQTRQNGDDRARGLVSGRVSGARVGAWTLSPPSEISDIVEKLWMGSWNLPENAPHTTELLGDPSMHLVFETSDAPTSGPRIVGVWTRLWKRTLAGEGRVFGIKLRAGAVRAVFPHDAYVYQNRILDMRELWPDATATFEILSNNINQTESRGILTKFLLTKRRRWSEEGLVVTALIEDVRRDYSMVLVDALARHSGYSVRTLQRLFRRHVGASPKQVIRRIRLQEAAGRLERGERSVAALAAELLYADQAHFCRDFKAAVGRSPSEFATTVHCT